MNFYNRKIANRMRRVQASKVVVYPDTLMRKTLVITCRNGRELERVTVRAKARDIERAYFDVYASRCTEAQRRGWYLFCDASSGRLVKEAA